MPVNLLEFISEILSQSVNNIYFDFKTQEIKLFAVIYNEFINEILNSVNEYTHTYTYTHQKTN